MIISVSDNKLTNPVHYHAGQAIKLPFSAAVLTELAYKTCKDVLQLESSLYPPKALIAILTSIRVKDLEQTRGFSKCSSNIQGDLASILGTDLDAVV